MSKRIDQLDAASDALVADGTSLFAIGDPATGHLYKVTKTQLLSAVGSPQPPMVYTALGTEGDTLTIAELSGRNILNIVREGQTIYPVAAAPNSTEYIWDGTDVTLGLPVTMAGERFLFIYV